MAYKVPSHVAWQMIGEEAVVMDLASGRTIGLNPTGSFIWRELLSNAPDLLSLFCNEFSVSEDVAARDIDSFLRDLIQQKLITEEL